MAPTPSRSRSHRRQMLDYQTLQTRGTALSRVALHNFKGHADLQLDMGKITVLIGPTSSGKSTILQALNLLKSALKTNDLSALDGHSQEYGHFADIVTHRNEDGEVGIDVRGRRTVYTKAGGDIVADFSYGASFGRSLRPTRVRATVDMRRSLSRPEDDGILLEHSYGTGEGASVVSGPGVAGSHQTSVRADDNLAPHIFISLEERPATLAFNEMFRQGKFFRSLLDGMWHVPFSRVVTSYTLPLRFNGNTLSPNRAQGAASLLSQISTSPSIQKKISALMQEIGLKQVMTRNVPVPESKDAAVSLEFVGADVSNPIVHEGSGLNQLVNMLAMLAYSPRGSVVTIEEPEIHLDPASQARLMRILVRQATEDDKQIVFTTHSDHLLFPLLAYIAKEDCSLGCEDVAMHYFNIDESGGVAGAERLAINKHGQIRGGLKGFWYADGLAMSEILG